MQQVLNQKYKIIDSKFRKAGAYGSVFKAINIHTNQIVAVKLIKKTVGEGGLECTVLRENAILKFLDDKNIVMLIESFIIDGKAYLVFPYFENNLRQFIVKQYKSKVPQNISKKIMYQLFSALKTAHSSRFMHRDIKFQNILVDRSKENPQNMTIKLADWGVSRKFNICSNQSLTDYVIPRIYRPPQLLFGTKKYTQTIDMWSLGCLFYELLLGQCPFPYVSTNLLLFQIQKKIGLSEKDDQKWIIEMYRLNNFDCDEEDIQEYRKKSLNQIFIQKLDRVPLACDLLKKMLRIKPDKRISAENALKHPYFDLKQ